MTHTPAVRLERLTKRYGRPTGYHPNEPTQRFTLHAAVLGARLLNWPSS